eukprot:SAG31_NODE_19543_length_599_cov_0.896000_2_plen_27_part_01
MKTVVHLLQHVDPATRMHAENLGMVFV